MELAIAALIGSIISGIVAAGSAAANTVSQAKTNQANKASVDATNAMNEQLTRESWARDDSQLQRARADAEAAGFSPLAALSNNLTNTAPATMQPYQAQAPQFDSSGLISSIQEGTRAYQNGKISDSQKGLIDSQKKAQDIQNDINNSTKWSQKLQNVANLAKTLKELDSQNLSNYEKASVLVASGIPTETVKKLIPYTTKGPVYKNTSMDLDNQLKEAQIALTETQDYHEFRKALNTIQDTELKKIQTERAKHDDNWYYSPIYDKNSTAVMRVPVYDFDDQKAKIRTIPLAGKSRAQIQELYFEYMQDFENVILTKSKNWEEFKSLLDTINPGKDLLDLLKLGSNLL